MTTSRAFAIMHAKACCLELARHLRAGCPPEDLDELCVDVLIVLQVAPADSINGGQS